MDKRGVQSLGSIFMALQLVCGVSVRGWEFVWIEGSLYGIISYLNWCFELS